MTNDEPVQNSFIFGSVDYIKWKFICVLSGLSQ